MRSVYTGTQLTRPWTEADAFAPTLLQPRPDFKSLAPIDELSEILPIADLLEDTAEMKCVLETEERQATTQASMRRRVRSYVLAGLTVAALTFVVVFACAMRLGNTTPTVVRSAHLNAIATTAAPASAPLTIYTIPAVAPVPYIEMPDDTPPAKVTIRAENKPIHANAHARATTPAKPKPDAELAQARASADRAASEIGDAL